MNKRNYKKIFKSKLFWAILAVLVPIVLALTPKIYETISKNKAPKFTIECEGLKDSNNPVYEVAEELNNTILGKFKIQINVDYKGNKIKGEIDIRIVTAQGNSIIVSKWDDFQLAPRDSQFFYLTTEDLFNYSGLPSRAYSLDVIKEDPIAEKKGKFNIEISQINGKILFKQTVTVLSSPWFHSTQISDSTIREGEEINAYVFLKDYGTDSKFLVVGLLYELPSDENKIFINSSALKVPWSPNEMLNSDPVDEARAEIDPLKFENKEGKISLNFPSQEAKKKGFKFEKGRIYLLETFVIKYLPYLKYSDDDWKSSSESWRVRDEPSYLLIFVLSSN
jgi:hypothetical protein